MTAQTRRFAPPEEGGMWWQQSWLTIQQEFSDLGNADDITRVVVRLIVAVALGGLLGYERESVGASAGQRTHMLVALGSALFILIPLQAGMRIDDLSRVLQGVTAGIGFLGAGAILKLRERNDIKGLTTAASVWLAAAIGVAAGMATLGFVPWLSTFAAFMANRATDQVRIVVAQPHLNVKMCGGYTGILTGKTGKTHQSVEDIAIFRAMPGVVTLAPADAVELRSAMRAMSSVPVT